MSKSLLDMWTLAVAASATILGFNAPAAWAQDSNACPVDGCEVTIERIAKKGDELAITFDSNFLPDMSKNHLHVWWGDQFRVEQVSNNAETAHGVRQGEWHPTAAYPDYVTTSAVSLANRSGSTTICVSAADRNHDIIDPSKYRCYELQGLE